MEQDRGKRLKNREIQTEQAVRDIADYFSADKYFHTLYPASVTTLAKRHWTPLEIAKDAAAFLATHKGAKVLDIGCGIGKFCLSAAHFAPDAVYYGVEQRAWLLQHAEKAKSVLGIKNAHFIHANFTKLDFSNYDHFYFFNSFYENLDGTDRIDDRVDFSNELFDYYNRYLYRQLKRKPAGTRIVTYHSLENEMPSDYYVVQSQTSNLLKFWVKA